MISSNTPPGGVSPISDRSYRSYDGELRSHRSRWWTVALYNIRSSINKPGFWVIFCFGMLPYIIGGIALKIGKIEQQFGGTVSIQPYTLHFFQAIAQQDFWIFLLALVAGTNIIAADLRANALLIVLSKPITKGDYLLGKWMGVFLPLYGATVIPAILFYICCALGLFGSDFISTEPTIIWRLLLATLVPAVVHASLLVGFSAWSKSGRIAGAAYAGFYLVSVTIFNIIGFIQLRSHSMSRELLQHLSVTGAIQGLAQCIYHVEEQPTRFIDPNPPMPSIVFFWEMLALCVGLSVLGIVMARVKINAVEVIRG